MTQAEAETRIIELERRATALEAQLMLCNEIARLRNDFINELLKRIPVTQKEAV